LLKVKDIVVVVKKAINHHTDELKYKAEGALKRLRALGKKAECALAHYVFFRLKPFVPSPPILSIAVTVSLSYARPVASFLVPMACVPIAGSYNLLCMPVAVSGIRAALANNPFYCSSTALSSRTPSSLTRSCSYSLKLLLATLIPYIYLLFDC
jgi:hypothetical protein